MTSVESICEIRREVYPDGRLVGFGILTVTGGVGCVGLGRSYRQRWTRDEDYSRVDEHIICAVVSL